MEIHLPETNLMQSVRSIGKRKSNNIKRSSIRNPWPLNVHEMIAGAQPPYKLQNFPRKYVYAKETENERERMSFEK